MGNTAQFSGRMCSLVRRSSHIITQILHFSGLCFSTVIVWFFSNISIDMECVVCVWYRFCLYERWNTEREQVSAVKALHSVCLSFYSCRRIPYDIIDQLIFIRIKNQLFSFAVYYAESGGKLMILIICPIAFLVCVRCSHRKGKTDEYLNAICSSGEF